MAETDARIVQRHIGVFVAADKDKQQGERGAYRLALVRVLDLELKRGQGAACFEELLRRWLLHEGLSPQTATHRSAWFSPADRFSIHS
jgi:hypothetical protein